jgi:hypothetical protein
LGIVVENMLRGLVFVLIGLSLVACGDSDEDVAGDDSDATLDVTSDATSDADDLAQEDLGEDGPDGETDAPDAEPDASDDVDEPDDAPDLATDVEPDAPGIDGRAIVDAACRQLAEANCAALFAPACDCGAESVRGYEDEAACVEDRIAGCFFASEFIVAAVSAGTIELLPASVDACVAGIAAQTDLCRFDAIRGAPECQMILADAVELGGDCLVESGVPCADGNGVCDPDTMKCEIAPGDGDPCVGPACKIGLFCEEGTCAAPREEGGRCVSDTVCPLNLVCRGEICQARVAIGQDCVLGNDCAFGAFCDGGTCVVSEPVGSPCEDLQICGQGFVCAENFGARTCGTGAPLNAECGRSAPCASGLYCASGLCAALNERGGACGSSDECVSGLVCRLGACTELPALGEDCLQDADAFCERGLGCDFDSGKCDSGRGNGEACLINGLFGYVCGDGLTCAFEADGSFCRPVAGLGAECSNDAMCGAERYCDFNTTTCANRLGEDQPCPFGGECEAGLECDRRFGEMVCVVPPESGAPCNDVCAGNLVCSGVGGLCAPSVCGI